MNRRSERTVCVAKRRGMIIFQMFLFQILIHYLFKIRIPPTWRHGFMLSSFTTSPLHVCNPQDTRLHSVALRGCRVLQHGDPGHKSWEWKICKCCT